MPDDLATTGWLVAARAIHFGACLGLFGVVGFDRFIAEPALDSGAPEARRDWNRIARLLILIGVPLALLSGVLWFAMLAVSLNSSGRPIQQIMKLIWTQTRFGQVWRIRLALWATVSAILAARRTAGSKSQIRLSWLALILSAALVMSLVWAGHGQTGRAPVLHLMADMLHLLAAGLWPMALLPLLVLLTKLCAAPDPRWPLIAQITSRFSALSLVAVSMLVITGIFNSWCLIGQFSDLANTSYGQYLLLKVGIFIVMLGFGAVNLLILKPRLVGLSLPAETHRKSASQLRWQVLVEVILGTFVLIVVAYLGLLPPSLE